uniref:RWP-RK domain-containing protein n=1 Tax=Tanacetum cinerariifolium TaxID=118510 RepID=A0A699JB83_TANCI|nr:hypothetical protein [Tanacetum cinerariifolium]
MEISGTQGGFHLQAETFGGPWAGKISFGLPGHAFEDRTPHQSRDMHDYPEDQRPPCEDKAIFSKKWGSFAVPVILANECIGVLEFVDTEPTHTYDGDINEVNKALKCAGFESFNIRDTQKYAHIPNKRRRTTNSSMYEHYNVLVPYFGLSKAKAMEKVNRKFFPKKQTETTCEATHIPDYSAGKAKKVKKEFEVIESTFRNALRNVGITEWPFIRTTTTKASCAPKTRINPMASATSSLGSLNADDYSTIRLVQGEASERSLEQTTITNTSALETQNDQIVSGNTSYTEALPESEYARPNFLPEGKRFEYQDHETTYLDALDHFEVDNDYTFPGQEIPYSSESRTDQTLYDKTSSIGIPNNAGDLNSGWDIDLDHYINVENDNLFLDQEIHDSAETRTNQTLCDGTSSFGILNDASCDFNSSWDKGVYERPLELIMTTSTSASGVHESSSAGLEQLCEMGDGLFFHDLFEQDFLMQEELGPGLSFSPTK